MADPQQPQIESIELPQAIYPAPPPFWKHFTTTNLERLETILSQPDYDPTSTSLPYDLLLLTSPAPPSSNPQITFYTAFNTTYPLPPQPTLPVPDELLFDPATLTSSSSTTSGNTRTHVKLLLRLLKSLNLNMLELMTIMSDNPVDGAAKVRDIGTLEENIHAVINLMRPHQAREGVKGMLEGRLREGWEEIEGCERVRVKVETFLREVEGEIKLAEEGSRGRDVNGMNRMNGINGVNGGRGSEVERKERDAAERARWMWEFVDGLDAD